MTVERDNGTLPAWNEESNQVGGNHIQRVCLDLGTPGSSQPVEGALPVTVTSLPEVTVNNLSGLIPPDTNYIDITYTDGSEEYIQTITCKAGGSSGTVLRTITYSYTASNNIQSIGYV